MAKIRNRAGTWYRDAKRKLALAPGEVATMSDHDAHQLMKELPWHFELVKEEAAAPKMEPAPAAEKPKKRPRWDG